jgi:hypothetical protein
MEIVKKKNTHSNERELIELLIQKKEIDLNLEDVKDIEKPGLLIEYLKDDHNNVEFEYAIKFYSYGYGRDGFESYKSIIKTTKLCDLDYKIIWYPSWNVKKKKDYIENMF